MRRHRMPEARPHQHVTPIDFGVLYRAPESAQITPAQLEGGQTHSLQPMFVFGLAEGEVITTLLRQYVTGLRLKLGRE